MKLNLNFILFINSSFEYSKIFDTVTSVLSENKSEIKILLLLFSDGENPFFHGDPRMSDTMQLGRVFLNSDSVT